MIWRPVANQLADFALLFGVQQASLAKPTPTDGMVQRSRTALGMALADAKHTSSTQASLCRNLVVHVTRCARPNHLHAPFMPRFARQRSHIGRFHFGHKRATPDFSVDYNAVGATNGLPMT